MSDVGSGWGVEEVVVVRLGREEVLIKVLYVNALMGYLGLNWVLIRLRVNGLSINGSTQTQSNLSNCHP